MPTKVDKVMNRGSNVTPRQLSRIYFFRKRALRLLGRMKVTVDSAGREVLPAEKYSATLRRKLAEVLIFGG